jgi:hypothetical protein
LEIELRRPTWPQTLFGTQITLAFPAVVSPPSHRGGTNVRVAAPPAFRRRSDAPSDGAWPWTRVARVPTIAARRRRCPSSHRNSGERRCDCHHVAIRVVSSVAPVAFRRHSAAPKEPGP